MFLKCNLYQKKQNTFYVHTVVAGLIFGRQQAAKILFLHKNNPNVLQFVQINSSIIFVLS